MLLCIILRALTRRAHAGYGRLLYEMLARLFAQPMTKFLLSWDEFPLSMRGCAHNWQSSHFPESLTSRDLRSDFPSEKSRPRTSRRGTLDRADARPRGSARARASRAPPRCDSEAGAREAARVRRCDSEAASGGPLAGSPAGSRHPSASRMNPRPRKSCGPEPVSHRCFFEAGIIMEDPSCPNRCGEQLRS